VADTTSFLVMRGTLGVPSREESRMAKWEIKQTVDYWAEGIEADTAEEAFQIYLKEQDTYYDGVVSEEIIEMEEGEE